MALMNLKSRTSCAVFLAFATLAGCGAGPAADGSGKDGKTDPSSPFGNVKGGSVLDVDFIEVQQPFWKPPAFVGDGCEGETGTWGKAVQMALYFFSVNRSGPGISHTNLQWRGDSHLEDGHIRLVAGDPNGVTMSAEYIEKWRSVLDPDGNGEVDMAGGYYDAGDFLKIGITSNFMVHTLGWTLWEFPEAFENTGLKPEVLKAMRWWSDFALKNTYIENPDEKDPWKWNVVAYGHQVGGASDHDCGWMPPELRRTDFCPRKGYFATHEEPYADATAGAAAALALTGYHFRNIDPDYATKCLNHAIALYSFAKKYAGTKWSVEGLYEAEDSFDDLAWAAVWLHEVLPEADQPGANELTALYASHKKSYLTDIVTPGTGWLENFRGGSGPKISCIETGGSCWAESWTYVWNSVRSGVFIKLADILSRTGNQYGLLAEGVKNMARDDSLAWVTGPKTAGGFSKKVDVSWGSARYNSGGQLVATAFARTFPDDVIPEGNDRAPDLAGQKTADVLTKWAKTQSEYLLGDNPLGESYMMGFGDSYADSAHHAATHASIYGLCQKPVESKHIAYGALVSGPNSGDEHSEDRCDYGSNEITIDYNAAFLGALAGNYAYFGGKECPDPKFPPAEPPVDEFFTTGRVNDVGACSNQAEISLVNETSQPPRYDETMTIRYFVSTAELREKGIDPSELKATIIYQNFAEEPALISEMKSCKLNSDTFYWEIAFPYEFWGEQQRLKGPRTVLLDLRVKDGPGCVFDGTNDWSFVPLTKEVVKTPSVPAYQAGKLVWGAEPECDEPPKVVVPPPVVQ